MTVPRQQIIIAGDHVKELVVCGVVGRIIDAGLIENILVVEDALHIALVRQSILDPVVVLERGLGTIQRIFDIAVLIKKIRKIHEHTGFIEFGDL